MIAPMQYQLEWLLAMARILSGALPGLVQAASVPTLSYGASTAWLDL